MPIIDAEYINALFARLGEMLRKPAALCLIGSTPGIASGQPGRQTADIDLWHAKSDYDSGELARACTEAGLLYDPRGELDQDAAYMQVVRPGVVRLPGDFALEILGRFGNLTIGMPPPEILIAAKLVRGSDRDVEDAIWWVRERGLRHVDLTDAIRALPRASDREAASENLTLIELVIGDAKKP